MEVLKVGIGRIESLRIREGRGSPENAKTQNKKAEKLAVQENSCDLTLFTNRSMSQIETWDRPKGQERRNCLLMKRRSS